MTQIKLFIYGAPFAGKTHLANTFPKPFIISTDGNAQYFDADYAHVTNLEEYAKALDKFINNENDYETLVIDNIGQVNDMTRQYELDLKDVIYEGDVNDHGRTWKMTRVRFKNAIKDVNAIKDKHWILIDHEREFIVKDQLGREVTNFEPMIDTTKENIHGHITRMTSMTGRVYREDTKSGTKHYLSLGEHGNELAGVRVPVKSKLIENNYDAIMENMKDE